MHGGEQGFELCVWLRGGEDCAEAVGVEIEGQGCLVWRG